MLGYGGDENLKLLLLALGTAIPFQLILNECLAVAKAGDRFAATSTQVFLIGLAQCMTCTVTLSLIGGFSEEIVIKAATLGCLLAMANLCSYSLSLIYYKLTINQRLSVRAAIVIGAIPGVVALTLYGSFFLLARNLPVMNTVLVIMLAPFPSLVQWLLVQKVAGEHMGFLMEDKSLKKPSTTQLILLVSVMMMVTALSTRFREDLSARAAGFAALAIVMLNSLTSLANTLTRASFLLKSSGSVSVLFLLSVLLVLVSCCLPDSMETGASISVIIALQFMTIAIVDLSRHLRAN